jgi:hypothetical protein
MALGSIGTWYGIRLQSAEVRSSVGVSGNTFGMELSLRRDVNIRLAVTWHWKPHMTIRQS